MAIFCFNNPNLSIAHQRILQFQNVKSSVYAGYILLHCILFLFINGKHPIIHRVSTILLVVHDFATIRSIIVIIIIITTVMFWQ